jgi:ketosteroid isomerase-like protein
MVDDADIIALSKQVVEFELRRDADALSAFLCDDYVGVDPSGVLITKEVFGGRCRNLQFQLSEHGVSDISVRVVGDFALEIGIMSMKGELGTFEFGGRYLYSHVWVRCHDSWKVQASQLTPMLRESAT